MKKIILKVEGMVCEGCEKRAKNALTSLKNVQEVVASYENGTVSIVAEEEVNEKELKEKLEDIGFIVKE